ncbi:MAG: histidine kinase dimerization/phospho-acceptor domain-containing protein, partial [Leptospiraceae bacterium]|nr:histidine kinase dimerization/phospho-acceptor domain-containing protein [Leptospiraceae bacterium]
AALEFIRITGAEIIVPFNLNRSVLAILYLVGRGEARKYSKRELRFLLEIRDITTVSLSNAALYERLQAMLFHLEEKVKERTHELANAQAQLIQQEKMASLGVMVAGIAHEINTPTSVVNGAAENLSKNLELIMQNIAQRLRNDTFFSSMLDEVRRVWKEPRPQLLSAIEKMRAVRATAMALHNKGGMPETDARMRADF